MENNVHAMLVRIPEKRDIAARWRIMLIFENVWFSTDSRLRTKKSAAEANTISIPL